MNPIDATTILVAGQLGLGIAQPVSMIHTYEDNALVDYTTGITIEQDGTGDAAMHFLLTGGQGWGIGIDNSGDSFKISTNNDGANALVSSILEVTTAGNIIVNGVGLPSGGKYETNAKISADTIETIFTASLDRGGGVGGVGLGLGYLFRIENGAGARHDASKFEVVWTDPSDGTEAASFGISIMIGGSFVEVLQCNDNAVDIVGNLQVTGNVVINKASGFGIQVDTAAPTFGWQDLLGDQFSKNTGATKPTLTAYNGAVFGWLFAVGDEAFMTFHIPHDYVAGTDIFLHIHWSHIGTLVTGGTVTFKATSIYAKGHNQAPFPAPVADTFTGTASTVQYQHILSEAQYSASTPTGIQLDTDDLEPDGVIEMTFEVDANDITVSGGGVPDVFIHYVDVHYQSTNMATKDKAPDFYA